MLCEHKASLSIKDISEKTAIRTGGCLPRRPRLRHPLCAARHVFAANRNAVLCWLRCVAGPAGACLVAPQPAARSSQAPDEQESACHSKASKALDRTGSWHRAALLGEPCLGGRLLCTPPAHPYPPTHCPHPASADDVVKTLESLSLIKYWKGDHIISVTQKIVDEHLKWAPAARGCPGVARADA